MTHSSNRDIIIIGGGLSGLSAAYELEQRGVSYTLIEVKPRLGGSISTISKDGFVMDGGLFTFKAPSSWQTLDDLNLREDLIEIASQRYRPMVAFKRGTASLIDVLAQQLTGTIIKRMAVTSIGYSGEGNDYVVCLENGLALDARGVIVAAPARYAERMFRTLSPDVSEALFQQRYQPITTVAMGFDAANRPESTLPTSWVPFFSVIAGTDDSERVPDGGLLMQLAVRVAPPKDIDAFIAFVINMLGYNMPQTYWLNHWAESHPFVHRHADKPNPVHELLPEGVALLGNCYQHMTLPERTERARAAAAQISNIL